MKHKSSKDCGAVESSKKRKRSSESADTASLAVATNIDEQMLEVTTTVVSDLSVNTVVSSKKSKKHKVGNDAVTDETEKSKKKSAICAVEINTVFNVCELQKKKKRKKSGGCADNDSSLLTASEVTGHESCTNPKMGACDFAMVVIQPTKKKSKKHEIVEGSKKSEAASSKKQKRSSESADTASLVVATNTDEQMLEVTTTVVSDLSVNAVVSSKKSKKHKVGNDAVTDEPEKSKKKSAICAVEINTVSNECEPQKKKKRKKTGRCADNDRSLLTASEVTGNESCTNSKMGASDFALDVSKPTRKKSKKPEIIKGSKKSEAASSKKQKRSSESVDTASLAVAKNIDEPMLEVTTTVVSDLSVSTVVSSKKSKKHKVGNDAVTDETEKSNKKSAICAVEINTASNESEPQKKKKSSNCTDNDIHLPPSASVVEKESGDNSEMAISDVTMGVLQSTQKKSKKHKTVCDVPDIELETAPKIHQMDKNGNEISGPESLKAKTKKHKKANEVKTTGVELCTYIEVGASDVTTIISQPTKKKSKKHKNPSEITTNAPESLKGKSKKQKKASEETSTGLELSTNIEVGTDDVTADVSQPTKKKSKKHKNGCDVPAGELESAHAVVLEHKNESNVNPSEPKSLKKTGKKRKKAGEVTSPGLESCINIEVGTSEITTDVSQPTKKKSKKQKHISNVPAHELEKPNQNYVSKKSEKMNNNISDLNSNTGGDLPVTDSEMERTEQLPSNNVLGQWKTATLDNKERENKFIRLLGGAKQTTQAVQRNSPKLFQNAMSTGNNMKKSELFKGLSGASGNFAMAKDQQEKLYQALESQFDSARSLVMGNSRGLGLGFERPAEEGKKFHIDSTTHKSTKFDGE